MSFPTDSAFQQVPMVAPFFGCAFGGWLYDMFLYTGESPINTPWMGLERVFRPTAEKWSSTAAAKAKEARKKRSRTVKTV